MLRYTEFEQEIRAIAEDDFMRWVYLLPAVPVHLRYRYVITIEAGFDMPTSFDHVMTSQTIHDDEYVTFLEQAIKSGDKV